MRQLDSSAVRALGNEAYLHFRLQVLIVLPVGRDLPRERRSMRQLRLLSDIHTFLEANAIRARETDETLDRQSRNGG